MANHNNSDFDQHDPKVFRETLGSFGTTTKPGGNQLQELQTKIRQGVKHVELHLASTGKGQFNVQDVPDKYGFEQRRTIMQLAKLNEQTLSVHGTFDVVSFSGLTQNGFDESQRLNSMKEIDETLKFAAETAKGGAVVFHIQGDPIGTDRGELNLSKGYLEWLQKNRPEEYKNIRKDYFDKNYLKRKFVNNPENEKEVKEKFTDLMKKNPTKYNEYLSKAKSSNENREAWEYYYMDEYIKKQKLSPDMNPLVMVGDKITGVERQQEMVDLKVLKNNNFNETEKNIFNSLGIHIDSLSIDDFQKAQAVFTNGIPEELKGKVTESDFNNLKDKVLITYDKILSQEDYLQAQADKTFQKKLIGTQIEMMELQKKDFEVNYVANEPYLERIKDLKRRKSELSEQIIQAKAKGDTNKVQELRKKLNGYVDEKIQEEMEDIAEKVQSGQVINEQEKQNLIQKYQELDSKLRATATSGILKEEYQIMSQIGQLEYQKLEKHDEMIAQINEQKRKLSEQADDVKAITDETFDKNTSTIGHLGIKALRYQLDLKKKSKEAQDKLKEYNNKLTNLEKEYHNATSNEEKSRLSNEMQKLKYQKRNWVGVKDYEDIDLINKPLYLAPENMLPGYGSLTSLEEFKATIRISQEEFAKKILSNESEYKKLKEEYEKETGLKITSHDDAIKLAKRHIGGTFDNAHAAVWLKHFKREGDESEEHRIERFNKWLNGQAEEMAREGIIKHIHFNDTQGKDDDHNLLGSGLLDIHDMRERLRKAGVKEPLIVEAGGRGADSVMHILNAFDIFNPQIHTAEREQRGYAPGSASVSDWINTKRSYENRPQYSQYGMSYSTFRHQQPQQGQPKGDWSQTGFL